jgi:two-component system cell cycle response regulator DivK
VSHRASVLIGEDHADTRQGYQLYLSSCGLNVSVAGDGESVLSSIHSMPRPDLLVLDIGLPVVDGWGVLTSIRSEPSMSDLPVIALTGHVFPAHKERAADLGCDAFLGKPCAPADLFAAITRVLTDRWEAIGVLRARSASNRNEQAILRTKLRDVLSELKVHAATLQERRRVVAESLAALKALTKNHP